MINKLNTLYSSLNNIEELDNLKFSSSDFKEANMQLELIVNQLLSENIIDKDISLSTDQFNLIGKILSKIEKLETKILTKANLLSSFSKSII